MLGKLGPILYFTIGLLVMFLMLEIRNKCYIKGNVRTYILGLMSEPLCQK